MKVAFLCGCLAEGFDGVGDYTRTLSAQLISNGYQVIIIALNDHYITAIIEEKQATANIQVQVYRLPSLLPQKNRFNLAARYLDVFSPLFISFQFVIYSFHPKGLPASFATQLKPLVKDRVFQIMFHEIWIGFTRISPVKHKITGYLQRGLIKNMVRQLRPNHINTSNLLYQWVLCGSGIATSVIPLFSNIAIVAQTTEFIANLSNKLHIDTVKNPAYTFIGIFGNLYPEAKLEEILSKEYDAAKAQNKQLFFIGFGRINNTGKKEFDRLAEVFANKIKCIHLGGQLPNDVSRTMQVLHKAISCTPAQHIGKSGVFAAFKLHSVPVLLSVGDVIPEYHQRITNEYAAFTSRPSSYWSVAYVANLYNDIISNKIQA